MKAKHNGIHHSALAVHDLERAIKFYTETLGFKHYHTQDDDWAMVYQKDSSLSLIPEPKLDEMRSSYKGSHPSHLGITFDSSKDVDIFYQHLCDRRVSSLKEPHFHRDGSYGFYFQDSEGNQLEAIYIPLLPCINQKIKKDTVAGILFGHGSRNTQWMKVFKDIVRDLQSRNTPIIWSYAFMELMEPRLNQKIEELKNTYPTLEKIYLMPHFIADGGHLEKDIPRLIQEAQSKFPNLEIQSFHALGEEKSVQESIASTSLHLLLDRLSS